MKIKKGDLVEVLTGKDKGKQSTVLKVDPSCGKITVKGVNVVKKHVKPNPNKDEKGGIIPREMSIHSSNLMHVNPSTNKKERLRIKFAEDGKKIRYFQSDDTVLG